MNQVHQQRWEQEYKQLNGSLRKPEDLLRRALSNEDYVDSAIIGGILVSDIVAGKVSDLQIPADVLRAFHEQYPNLEGFVDSVKSHASDPDALAGLLNGVKGKLFEQDYVSWLNDGHLPDGFHAELAHQANNPAWDIAIKDAHGHINDVLQAKATASMDYVHDALAAHPDIDVVTTSEVFHALSNHGDDLSQLIDSHQSLSDLTDHVQVAVGHAEAASHVAFHVPWIAMGWAIVQNHARYRDGKISFEEALRNTGRRVGLALGAATAGFVVADLITPGAGVAAGVGFRLYAMRMLGNLDLRDAAQRSVAVTVQSSESLAQKVLPRILETKLLPVASAATAR